MQPELFYSSFIIAKYNDYKTNFIQSLPLQLLKNKVQ